jgi:hypothetical protein
LRQAAQGEADPGRAQALRDAAAAIEAGDADATREALDALAGEQVPVSVAQAFFSADKQPAGPPRRVAVFDPSYAKILASAKGDGRGGEKEPAADAARGLVPREDAWAAARRRALEALAEPKRIPPRYSQLVRDFFVTAD